MWFHITQINQDIILKTFTYNNMENKTWIIILSILLACSFFLNITLFYTISFVNQQWENDYEKNDIKWCEIANRDNKVINDFIDELTYYSEDYGDIPYMEDLDCFS